MTIFGNVTLHLSTGGASTLAEIQKQLAANHQIIMATLKDVLADVKAEKEIVAGVSTFIAGLKGQLTEALNAKGQLTAEQQQVIDETFAEVEANKAALIGAVNVGTPDETPKDVADTAHIEASA